MPSIIHWVTTYGYAAIFCLLVLGIVGLPVPDEMLLTFVGYLVSRSALRAPATLASAFLGSACGITVSYLLGRTTGVRLLEQYGLKLRLPSQAMVRVHSWFRQVGRWTLVIGYFVPGVRHCTAYVAGASQLEYVWFAVYAYLGAAIWSSSFICLGYFMGEDWVWIASELHRFLLILSGLVAGASGFYFLWWRKRKIS